ncbi:hypothetical protein JRQ81_009027 [Phrynocephalus forsythii]|uniref:Uncharacterized protein n=1 Tax=Phrynocephalus forsythii TaxID=171643 RepID=A0A9Q0XD61_9SAUR|nr:hypothetical protein JRQ81_009027 [Phrynocephalus forsythii]
MHSLRFPLCIPSVSLTSQGGRQDFSGETQSHPDCTLVAQAALVCIPSQDVQQLPSPGPVSGPAVTKPWPSSAPRPSTPPAHSVDDGELIESIISACRKPSTTKLYHYKWRRFLFYVADKGIDPINPSLTWILQYLLHLKRSGLTLSSLRVHLSAIVAHQPPVSPASSFFRHPWLKHFLRGLKYTFPDRKPIPPQWSLSLWFSELYSDLPWSPPWPPQTLGYWL